MSLFARKHLLPGLALCAALVGCGTTQVTSQGSSDTSSAADDTFAPVVTLAASSNSVNAGTAVTLQWSATNAQSCTASGGWSGTEATSGSQQTAALSATTQFTLTCTGTGGAASQSVTVAVSTGTTVSLNASPPSVVSGGTSTLTWSSTDATSCAASGGWSGTVAVSGSQSTGAITTPTSFTLTCTGPGGSASQSATVSLSAGSPTGGSVSRPSYNTGNGFFVLNGKLYDANGNEFRMRGVDRCHYDSDSAAGIAKSGANAVRMFMYGLSVGAPKYVSILKTQHIAHNEVPIPSMPLFPDGTLTSGDQSTSELAAGVAWWVANAATFTAIDKYLIINIANEWGPSNSTVWRDSYISAIASLRAAGYLGPLLIDSGGYGQDMKDLLNYSTDVFNSDPQKNIIFSLHIYGNIPTASVAPDLAALAALSASAGMAFIVGEFGPGRDIGPSPTETTPGDIITAAEASGIGWLGWAWDDNNLSGGASNNNGFSMTLKGPGIFTQASDLTEYGQDVVLNPTYGLQALATPASIF